MKKEFKLDPRLLRKIELFSERIHEYKDAVIVVDGYEGEGKSNLAAGICYYAAKMMNREFSVDNVYFDLDKLLAEASTTEGKVFMWDEATLGGLKMQRWNKEQQKLMQFLNMCRARRHFFVFLIPRLKHLGTFIVERCMGFVHCYSKSNVKTEYKFCYYSKAKLERLYDRFLNTRKMMLMGRKNYSFNGRFAPYIYKYEVIDPVRYNEKKMKAFKVFEEGEVNGPSKSEMRMAGHMHNLLLIAVDKGLTKREIASQLGVSERTVYNLLERGATVTAASETPQQYNYM